MSHPSGSSVSTSPNGFPPVRIDLDSYAAHITVDTWKQEWPELIIKLGRDASKYVLLTDSNIDRLYGPTLRDGLTALGASVLYFVLPPGEHTKCRETKARIEDWMFAQGCGRDTVILAFGGGVMGDLCGYVASGYMRGIPFIQLPTSFLAMVDSSIGGKTGIDTTAGKNLLGAFHRPLAVLIDLSLLLTLPQRELCNGMAESIKAGIICSLPLFELMESNVDGLLKQKDLTLLAKVVEASVSIKAHVVLNDEKEAGLRSILNFGHSIGHAVEALMQPDLLHGECVSIGMMEEIILARSYGLVGSGVLRRVDNVLKSFCLPTRIPAHLTTKQLLEKMAVDKKNKGGKKELVMVTSIGSVKSTPKYTTMIPDADLELLLSPSIGVTPTSGPINGEVSVPGSKSLSNRILLLASLGGGSCRVRGLLHSQDTQVMIDSLRQLGIQFEWQDGLETLELKGCEGRIKAPSQPLYLGNAGTASRFLTSVACLLKEGEVTLTGNARMQERPIGDLVDSLRRCGNSISYVGPNPGCLPLLIRGSPAGLKGGLVELSAGISSQYVSSVLLAAPYASGAPLELSLETGAGKKVVSKPFIDMTVQLMRRFGIQVEENRPFTYRVPQGAWTNPTEFAVEGDASSATYPLGLAAISGGRVTVNNVGSESLQGDAQFYTILRDMGCTVSQTATSTTVCGPDRSSGGKLIAVDRDMDSMTDTFMTLAAVAVFAEGTTRITNIANQRVKECNRLAVMVSELRKIGVEASESETGIDIVGVGMEPDAIERLEAHIRSLPNSVAVIACHDDHRIAMSFALIGSRVGGIVLDEKRCVDKTYPEFWEHLTQKFGVKGYAPKEGSGHTNQHTSTQAKAAQAKPDQMPPRRDSVILIGMRGSGKTFLGEALSLNLRRAFFDLDSLLEARLGMSLKAFVESVGWDEFRKRELAILEEVIRMHPFDSVIACGGGVIETPAAVELLKQQPIVIQLRRHINDVVTYLATDRVRPGFEPRTVWERRQPIYKEASKFEFSIVEGDTNWESIKADLAHFVRSIIYPTRMTVARNTFFLSLTDTDLASGEPSALKERLDLLTRGVDVIEVRVDLLTSRFDDECIRDYLSRLRRLTKLPLLYTVRSAKQGGRFIDYEGNPAAEEEMFKQVALGFRFGCAGVDIEAALTPDTRTKLFQLRQRHPATRIIISHHLPKSNGGSLEELKELFHYCANSGPSSNEADRPDVAKVVVSASDASTAIRMVEATSQMTDFFSASRGPAVIGLAMGSAGRLSRVCNQVLTPVTHPALPNAAAPGQLSVQQIMKHRQELCLYPFDRQAASGARSRWILFGSPITHSRSPDLHNAAFEFLHLSNAFVYDKVDTSDVSVVARELAQPEFGGANVTIPLKESVLGLVAYRSPAVDAIGAINTIVRNRDGSLRGENTDWQGIHYLFVQRMQQPTRSDIALVIGAGGTARAAIYAMQQAGFDNDRILVFNPRTREKAQTLAKHFGVTPLYSLDRPTIAEATKQEAFTIRAIVSTIPGSSKMRIEDARLLDHQNDKPVVMDASYIPADTAFLVQCMCDFGIPAPHILRGLDLMVAQGFFGMASWLDKPVPDNCQAAMELAARTAYAKHQQQAENPQPDAAKDN